jgi:hypothetical protein
VNKTNKRENKVGDVWFSNDDKSPAFFWVAGVTQDTLTFLTIARQEEYLGEENGKLKYRVKPLFNFDSKQSTPYKLSSNITVYPPLRIQGFMKRNCGQSKEVIGHGSLKLRPFEAREGLTKLV